MLRARLYDWECTHVLGRTDQDVGFWLDVLDRSPRPCLELACGTGRLTAPLVAAGFDVVGLDRDPDMLVVANQRLPNQRLARRVAGSGQRGARLGRPHLIAGDMRQFACHCRFGVVLIPYNSLQLLTDPAEQRSCLRQAAAHLVDGGVVGLEVTDFQQGAANPSVAEEVLHTGAFDGNHITLIGGLTHDFQQRVSRYRRRFLGPTWVLEDDIAIRSMNRAELAALLADTGLVTRFWWNDGPVVRVVAARSAALSSSPCRDQRSESW